MNNDDTLELTTLCGALADGTITSSQQARLNEMLKASAEARQFYIHHAALSVSLYSYAAELQSDAPRSEVKKLKTSWWMSAAITAALAVSFTWWMQREAPATIHETKLVALMTGTKDCVWSGIDIAPGTSLQAGQRLDLSKGIAEITFDSGAQVTMEGPASLVVTSAWDTALESGAVKASVPKEAIGFRVSHPSVEVIDLGTEFSMIADAAGAEVFVLKGSVEAVAHGDVKPIVLLEQESHRFAGDGISAVPDRERKFARFAKIFKLDRAVVNGDYAHWSFDDSKGSVLFAEAKDKKKSAVNAKLNSNATATLTEGRWSKGLSFDGRLAAKATVPGMSASSAARTIAFWVRVPEGESTPTGSSSILGWGQRNNKHGTQSARIAWNKFPAHGPYGAIRTELGRALIMGRTNVRDNRWHHVAVVLVPDALGVLQAKQYVDGHLDGSSINDPRPHHSTDIVKLDAMDALWLGRSPIDRPKEGFFMGALDELFIIDRAMSPIEIVRLMQENHPDAVVAEAL